jgi:hypothetical protein
MLTAGTMNRRMYPQARCRVLGFAVCLLVFALLAGGCATTRGEVNLRVLPPANPTSGPSVKIAQVNDRRVFYVNPPDPSIPSLMDDEINNTGITRRAIARKRGGFGKALGDILLPEGQTVPQLVADALTRAFRESGYRVLQPEDNGYAEASAITADIDQFWSWFTPGFWVITLDFRADVRIQAEVGPFQNGGSVQGSARESGMAATSDTWRSVVDKGIEDLIRNLRGKLGKR